MSGFQEIKVICVWQLVNNHAESIFMQLIILLVKFLSIATANLQDPLIIQYSH